MEQVPTYAIIGNGRLASHFAHYFNLLKIPFIQWSRSNNSVQDLKICISKASHVLLLISDQAIEPFIIDFPFLKNKILIHCSGSLNTPLALSVHPLMTFSKELYDLKTYESIPFICEKNVIFSDIFPQLPNPHHCLDVSLKPYYHTLCVMSNNFTTLLWQKFYQELSQTLNLPMNIIHPFLQQTFHNLLNNPLSALTGPLVRNDQSTISSNLKSLENDPYQNIYKTFLETYKTIT